MIDVSDAQRCADLRNEDFFAGFHLEFVIVDRLRDSTQNDDVVASDELQTFRDAGAFDLIELGGESHQVAR